MSLPTSSSVMALVFATGLMVAAPALAQDAPATPAPPKDKKVCRRIDVTGSIVGTRAVCHTKAEWAKIDGENGSRVDDALGNQRGSRSVVTGS
jgi:predicted secreted protein